MPNKELIEEPTRYFLVQKLRDKRKPINVAICPTLEEATITLLEREQEHPTERLQIVRTRPIEEYPRAESVS